MPEYGKPVRKRAEAQKNTRIKPWDRARKKNAPEPHGVKIPRIAVDPFWAPEKFLRRPNSSFRLLEIKTGEVVGALNYLISLQELSLGGDGWSSESHLFGIPCMISKSRHEITVKTAGEGSASVNFHGTPDGYEAVGASIRMEIPAGKILEDIPRDWEKKTKTTLWAMLENGGFSHLKVTVDFPESGAQFIYTIEDINTEWYVGAISRSSRTYTYQENLGPIRLFIQDREGHVITDATGQSTIESANPLEQAADFLKKVGNYVLEGGEGDPPKLKGEAFDFACSLLSGPEEYQKTVKIVQALREEEASTLEMIFSNGEIKSAEGSYLEGTTRKEVKFKYTQGEWLHGQASYKDDYQEITAQYSHGRLHDPFVAGKEVAAWALVTKDRSFRHEEHYFYDVRHGPSTRMLDDASITTMYRDGLEHTVGGDWSHGDVAIPETFKFDASSATPQEVNDFLHATLMSIYKKRKDPILKEWYFHPLLWTWVRYHKEDSRVYIQCPYLDSTGQVHTISRASFNTMSTSVYLRSGTTLNIPGAPKVAWELNRRYVGEYTFMEAYEVHPYASLPEQVGRRFVGGLLERHLDESLKKSLGLEALPPHIMSFVSLVILASVFKKDPQYQRLIEKAMEVSLTGMGTGILKAFLERLREDPGMTQVLETYATQAQELAAPEPLDLLKTESAEAPVKLVESPVENLPVDAVSRKG